MSSGRNIDWLERLLWPIVVALVAGILILMIEYYTGFFQKIAENPVAESPTPTQVSSLNNSKPTPMPPPSPTFTPIPNLVCGTDELGPWPPINGQGQDIFIDSGDGYVHADFWQPGGILKAGYDEVSVIIEPGTKVTIVNVAGQVWKYDSGCTKEYVEAQVVAHQNRRRDEGKSITTVSLSELPTR